jgi:hypothetical protein
MTATLFKLRFVALAVAISVTALGCASCSPGGCSTCENQCPLCRLARMCRPGCDQVNCGDGCSQCEACGNDRGAGLASCEKCKLCQRPQPGPPPATLRPVLPPKFLPVPIQPVLSPARPDAPEPSRGDVEAAYRNQLTVPGRD